MKKNIIRWPMAVLSLGLLFSACQKSIEDNGNAVEAEMSELALDDQEVDGVYSDVFEMVAGVDDQLGLGESEIFGEANPDNNGDTYVPGNPPNQRCVTVTITPRDPQAFPKTVVYNFGAGCTGPDGKTRSGKIITVYTRPLVVPGAEATTRFEDYKVQGNKVEGVHITKNESTSASRIFTRVVREGKITRPNGDYRKWGSRHTSTQVEGLGTPGFHRDDAFTLTGGAEGERKVGDKTTKWSRIIMSPVYKANACKWPAKGEVRITRNDEKALLNYGDGTCDDKATLSINGRTREITLR